MAPHRTHWERLIWTEEPDLAAYHRELVEKAGMKDSRPQLQVIMTRRLDGVWKGHDWETDVYDGMKGWNPPSGKYLFIGAWGPVTTVEFFLI